jgi:hypothetical protein
MKKFPHYKQPDSRDCGPTCLRMVTKHHGRNYSLAYLREKILKMRKQLKIVLSFLFFFLSRKLYICPVIIEKPTPGLAYPKELVFEQKTDLRINQFMSKDNDN